MDYIRTRVEAEITQEANNIQEWRSDGLTRAVAVRPMEK